MKKAIVGLLVLIGCLVPVSIVTRANENYSFLDEYSLKELEELQDEITARIKQLSGDESDIIDVITTDEYELTITNIEFTDEIIADGHDIIRKNITPSNDGQTMIHIDGTCLNLTADNLKLEKLPTAIAIYEEDYTYNGHVFVDQNSAFVDSADTNVCIPLGTCHYHCLILVPTSLSESDGKLIVYMEFQDGSIREYDVRSAKTIQDQRNAGEEPSEATEFVVEEPETSHIETTGEKNALRSAKNYLSFMNFSYSGLIKQLKYEGYTEEEATYGVDHCGADWNEQATGSAKNYLSFMSFSRDGLINQLEYDGYTHEQAVYGAEQNGY